MTSARCPRQTVGANQMEKENNDGKDLSRLGPGKAQNLKPPLALRVSQMLLVIMAIHHLWMIHPGI